MAHSPAQTAGPPARIKYAALLLFSYALLLIMLGFRLYEDAAIPPWAAFLRYPESFQKDLLAQGFRRVAFSERTVAAHLYAPLIGRWWLVPVLHAAFGLLLIAGLHRLATHLTGQSDFAWIALWILLPGLYHQHWGSNELYYPQLQPSLIAKALGVWVWVGLLQRRGGMAVLALIAAVAVHPAVGWQLALFAAPLSLALPAPQKALYGAVMTLALLQAGVIGREAFPPPETKSLWETVYLEFRMGMHFNPTAFKVRSHFLFALLLVGALILSFRQKSLLRRVFLLYALALSAYVVNYYTIRWGPLWYSQLARATVWLKPLALFTLLGYLRQRWPLRCEISPALSTILMAIAWLLTYRLARHEIIGLQFLQILDWAKSPAYRIGQCAQKALPDTALIAAAPSHEAQAAQFFTLRSAFLRLDAQLRAPDAITYRHHVRLLYGIDPAEGYPAWQKLTRQGATYYDSMALRHPQVWRAAGITHIITDNAALHLALPCVCQAENLALWALPTAAAHTETSATPTAALLLAGPERPPPPP